MIVIQLRGSRRAKPNIQASLRSLGLGRPQMMSLRHVNAVNWGYIKTARDYVAVALLDGVWYKKKITENLESAEYGTASKPAAIWRTEDGAYFGYEYSPPKVVTFMSVALRFSDVLLALQEVDLEIDVASDQALVVGKSAEKQRVERREGRFLAAMDTVDPASVLTGVIPCRANYPLKVTWRAPYQRFHDLVRVSAETGIICHDEDRVAAMALAARLAEPELQGAGVSVPMRVNGDMHGWNL